MQIGGKIVHYKKISSTNAAAKSFAQFGAPTNLIISADVQTQGRGRLNREWHTFDGSIACSVILRPHIPSERLWCINICVSAALLDFCDSLNIRGSIKWPNDLYVERKKAGGILIEITEMTGTIKTVIIGVGVNINTAKSSNTSNLSFEASSLNTNKSLNECRDLLYSSLSHRLETMNSYSTVRSAFKKVLDNTYLIGKMVQFETSDGLNYGRVVGLDNKYNLVVLHKNLKYKIYYGDIVPL